jgi:hypothetical protein
MLGVRVVSRSNRVAPTIYHQWSARHLFLLVLHFKTVRDLRYTADSGGD